MPLELTPLLDLTPLDEDEEDRPLEREPATFVAPPPMPGKPEVLVEGSTRATIPASLDIPDMGKPVVNVEGRTLEPDVLASVEPGEWAFDSQRPLVNPEIIRAAVDIGTAMLPRDKFTEGVRSGVTGMIAGTTSPESIAMTPAFAVPYVGPALAMGLGAKSVGAGAGRAVGGVEAGEAGEIGEGLTEAVMGGLMVAGGGMGAISRPAIPPRIVEAIAKADAVGLTKSAQAVADVVKREQPIEIQAKVEPISDRPQQLETPIEKGIPDAVREPIAAESLLRQERPEVELQGVREPQVETAIPREPARAQSGAQPEVLLTGPEVIKSIVELPDAEAGNLRQKPAVEAGMKLTEADVPALEAARDKAGAQMLAELEAGNDVAFKAQYGKNIWFSGAIEGARRKGPNYDTFIEQQKAAATTQPEVPVVREQAIPPPSPTAPASEAVPARPVGGEPAGRPAVGAAEATAKPPQELTEHQWNTAVKAARRKAYGSGSKKSKVEGEAELKRLTLGLGPDVQAFTGTRNLTHAEMLAKARTLPEPAGPQAGGEQPTPAASQAVPAAKPALASAEAKLSQVVNQTIEQSSPTRLGVSPAATMRPTDVVLGAPDLRSISPAVEARWQAAVKGTENIIDKVKTHADEAWKSVTREYADLPPREFPAEIDVLRRLRASRNASARTAVDVLKGVTHNLGPKQYGVFNRVALLEDLVKDVESGKYATGNDLPFGYKDAGELTADLNKFRSVAESTPQIKAALERRQEFMDSLRSTLVERGFLPESILQDPRYFHHQVLMYMAERNAPTSSRSFRDWFSGWQKKRTGSSQDYNRQYVEAEAEVLSDAFNKITMQDLQGEMRGISDLTAELKELHGAEWRQHIPKTHTEWQPKRGNIFYQVQTVAERVMDRYLSGLGDILPSEFKEALAVGGRRQEWVIPKPLAKVLDNIAPRPDNWIGRLATTAQNSWKRYILLNPLRAAKYNLNNLSGDLDFLFAAQPKIFKEFKSSASDMWGFHVKGKSAVGDIKEAMQDGVIGSGWRASELPDIARSDYFNWLTGEKPKLVERYWDWIGKRSDAREDTGRLASYRFAKKEWEAGRPFYGASVPADVNALATPRLKAAKVAREILIDYGRGTEFSNFTRQKLVPFFKWMEGNFVRYQQLIRNVPEHEGAGPRVAGATGKKAATLGLRMGAAYGIINLWNHMFFPKEEEELGEARNQLHLILGRDDQGNVQTIRFQGALSDLLGWVGGEDLPQDVKDLATGKASVGDKMEDAYEAGISRAVNASLPFPKTAAEIGLGRSFYPNALSPRPVRDKAEHAAGLFSLKPVYQWLAGKPHKPLRQEIANLISYTTDPGEAAYNTTRHMAGEWLEEHGEERASVIPGKRSNALYYYKQALRYKDQETAKKFLDEYNKLGGKREGLSQSIKASAPLSMLGNKRKAFLDSLSPQEQEAVKRAEEWYRQVYAMPPTPNPNP